MRLLLIVTLFVCALMATACDRKVAGGSVDGAKIFSNVCARCHGPGGQPNSSMIARYGVKNLRTERVQRELTDSDIRAQILNGSKNKQMPSFDGAISDEQLDAVIAHIRTFANVSDAAPKTAPAPSEGNNAAKSKDDAGAGLGAK